MKTKTIILFSVLFVLGCKSPEISTLRENEKDSFDYTGHWIHEGDSLFAGLHIQSVGNSITGSLFYTTKSGDDYNYNILGIKKDGCINAQFTSSGDDSVTGRAAICEISGDKVKWCVEKWFGDSQDTTAQIVFQRNLPTPNLVMDTTRKPLSNADRLIGSWVFEDRSELGEYGQPAAVFSIDLVEIADSVRGIYSAVTNFGNKIDCNPYDDEYWNGEDNGCRMSGKVENNQLTVTFSTSWGGGDGKAVITLLDEDHIFWRVIKDPEGAFVFFGPYNVILSKYQKK